MIFMVIYLASYNVSIHIFFIKSVDKGARKDSLTSEVILHKITTILSLTYNNSYKLSKSVLNNCARKIIANLGIPGPRLHTVFSVRC